MKKFCAVFALLYAVFLSGCCCGNSDILIEETTCHCNGDNTLSLYQASEGYFYLALNGEPIQCRSFECFREREAFERRYCYCHK